MEIDNIIRRALAEDIGQGDVTTESCVPADAMAAGKFRCKEDGVICGLDVLRRVFETVDARIGVSCCFRDGDRVKTGDIAAEISGPARPILIGERCALNLLQRMSGIATRTREAVDLVAGLPARITDTRKTTPGLRVLEKYAVRMGGGANHRFNLSDGVLIKDNHIVAAGGITAAVNAARERAHHLLKIEVETSDFDQINEALAASVDIIMLDNMSLEDMAKAVRLIDGRALVEASGNMGSRDLRQVAETGVDIISIGALTHTVRALDISLRFEPVR